MAEWIMLGVMVATYLLFGIGVWWGDYMNSDEGYPHWYNHLLVVTLWPILAGLKLGKNI